MTSKLTACSIGQGSSDKSCCSSTSKGLKRRKIWSKGQSSQFSDASISHLKKDRKNKDLKILVSLNPNMTYSSWPKQTHLAYKWLRLASFIGWLGSPLEIRWISYLIVWDLKVEPLPLHIERSQLMKELSQIGRFYISYNRPIFSNVNKRWIKSKRTGKKKVRDKLRTSK